MNQPSICLLHRGENLESFFHIVHPQNKESLFRRRHGGEIGILDVDLGTGEAPSDPRKTPRTVVVLDHQHIAIDHQRAMGLQQGDRPTRIAHHHSHHSMVDRVGHREPVDIDFIARQRIAHVREGPRTIGDKDGQLFNNTSGFHR